MRKTFYYSFILLFLLCITGCYNSDKKQNERNNQLSDQALAAAGAAGNAITQVATIDALLAGVYDGHMSLEALRTFGDFGIGTFEGLDGEMILLDGVFYQIKADGKVYQLDLETQTPFACVINFSADNSLEITGQHDMSNLEALIDSLVPQQNRFVAFRLPGQFNHMRTRSVPA